MTPSPHRYLQPHRKISPNTQIHALPCHGQRTGCWSHVSVHLLWKEKKSGLAMGYHWRVLRTWVWIVGQDQVQEAQGLFGRSGNWFPQEQFLSGRILVWVISREGIECSHLQSHQLRMKLITCFPNWIYIQNDALLDEVSERIGWPWNSVWLNVLESSWTLKQYLMNCLIENLGCLMKCLK